MTQFNTYSHLTEKARAIVTARGRPSGTATTKMVTPEMKKPRTSDQCTELSQCSLQHNSERKYSQGQHCQYTTPKNKSKYRKKRIPCWKLMYIRMTKINIVRIAMDAPTCTQIDRTARL
jgi:Tfp pilus assembly ATPase PilU